MLWCFSPLLVSALQTHVQHPDNEQARTARNYAVDQILSATHEIIVVVSSTELDESGYDLIHIFPLCLSVSLTIQFS